MELLAASWSKAELIANGVLLLHLMGATFFGRRPATLDRNVCFLSA
jgi:hypothetical protein